MTEYEITLIVSGVLVAALGGSVFVMIRVVLAVSYHTMAEATVYKYIRMTMRKYPIVAADNWQLLKDLMTKYPSERVLAWKIHVWTYNQAFGDLEDELDEVVAIIAKHEMSLNSNNK